MCEYAQIAFVFVLALWSQKWCSKCSLTVCLAFATHFAAEKADPHIAKSEVSSSSLAARQFWVSRQTVSLYLHHSQVTGTVSDIPCSGNPWVTTWQQDCYSTAIHMWNSFQAATFTAGTIPGLRRVCSGTAQNCLSEQGLQCKTPCCLSNSPCFMTCLGLTPPALKPEWCSLISAGSTFKELMVAQRIVDSRESIMPTTALKSTSWTCLGWVEMPATTMTCPLQTVQDLCQWVIREWQNNPHWGALSGLPLVF